jgi:hypothetical protein
MIGEADVGGQVNEARKPTAGGHLDDLNVRG